VSATRRWNDGYGDWNSCPSVIFFYITEAQATLQQKKGRNSSRSVDATTQKQKTPGAQHAGGWQFPRNSYRSM
jgi:hypothetical protein